ncbi:MAG: hypothetical protein Q7R39_05240 [Dehalococcoidia bacterium]|nr:hypothetical protein [Dehalococcoidia bacterium]
MSEYRYYEFQAIDKPLTKQEMDELRGISTRATITPTRFINEYNWGDLKGDPVKFMERYFDAFVYVANWRTRWLMLRLPKRLVDLEMLSLYCAGDGFSYREAGDNLILQFQSEGEGGDEEDGEGWLSSLIPLRAEILNGDFRSLYLGWLLCAQEELCYEAFDPDDEDHELDSADDESGDEWRDPDDEGNEPHADEVEPPVPPGLADLTASQKSLADFLRIGDDFIAVAAERSRGSAAEPPSLDELQNWVRALPEPERTSLLLQFLSGDNPHLRTEVYRRFRHAHSAEGGPLEWDALAESRTVRQLVAEAGRRAEARLRAEAERKAKERAERERAQAEARARYLDSLSGREDEVWRQIEALIMTKNPAKYDEALQLLKNLKDLGTRTGQAVLFKTRLGQLCDRHSKKPSLLRRIEDASLG